jgi:hypothetical protein
VARFSQIAPPKTWEETELHAAAAMVLVHISVKTARHAMERPHFDALSRYRFMRLHEEFPDSPWKKSILELRF